MTVQALVVGATWWTVFLVNASQGHPWRGLALATAALTLGVALLPWAVSHDARTRAATPQQP